MKALRLYLAATWLRAPSGRQYGLKLDHCVEESRERSPQTWVAAIANVYRHAVQWDPVRAREKAARWVAEVAKSLDVTTLLRVADAHFESGNFYVANLYYGRISNGNAELLAYVHHRQGTSLLLDAQHYRNADPFYIIEYPVGNEEEENAAKAEYAVYFSNFVLRIAKAHEFLQDAAARKGGAAFSKLAAEDAAILEAALGNLETR